MHRHLSCRKHYPPTSNMTMEIPPVEDVLPIEHGDFPMSCRFSRVYPQLRIYKEPCTFSNVTSSFHPTSGYEFRAPHFVLFTCLLVFLLVLMMFPPDAEWHVTQSISKLGPLKAMIINLVPSCSWTKNCII